MVRLMPTLKELRQELSVSLLAARTSELLDLGRPTVGFTKSESRSSSYLWGETSVLSADVEWPTYQGRPLEAAAVFDLGECPINMVDPRLPQSGALLFFLQTTGDASYLHNSDDWARVIYDPEPGPARKQPEGAYLLETMAPKRIDLTPVFGLTFPNTVALDTANEWSRLTASASRASSPYLPAQLFGHVDPWQIDPTEDDWILLAEINGQAEGSYYFLIDRSDLAEGHFERAICEYQCS